MSQPYDKDFALPLFFKVRSRDEQELGFYIRVLVRLEDAELFEETFATDPSGLKIPVLTAFFSDQGDLKKIVKQEFSGYAAGQLGDDSASLAQIAKKLQAGFAAVFSENGLRVINIEHISSKPAESDEQLMESAKIEQAVQGKKAHGFPRWAYIAAPIVLVLAVGLVILNGVTGIFSPRVTIPTATTTTTPPPTTEETATTTAFTPPPLVTGTPTIRLVPGGYTPLDLTILAGSTVVFENPDDVDIVLVGDYPFNQKILSRGSAKLTFAKAGTYKYWIEGQPDYKGIITVN